MALSTATRCEIHRLGNCKYQVAEELQKELLERRADGDDCDHLIVCEFEPVITVGRAADLSDFQHLNIPTFAVPRGGQATFHGPGQLVVYPIIGLSKDNLDLHAYLHLIEQALIDCISAFDLLGTRDPRNTGCWINGRKVASIGVAVRRWVSYHGLALNISTELNQFAQFSPCGLAPDTMTNMDRESQQAHDFDEVANMLIAQLGKYLSLAI